jgi:hypothetical protein
MQDMVDKIHFTTKGIYTLVNHSKKKIAKLTLTDPEPIVPETFDLYDDTVRGDYVLVKVSSINKLGAASYNFKQVDGEVLTSVRPSFLCVMP